jgi:hypothetical protein
MSVLLSWHEKVRPTLFPRHSFRGSSDIPRSATIHPPANTITACGNSWPRLHRSGHERSTYGLSIPHKFVSLARTSCESPRHHWKHHHKVERLVVRLEATIGFAKQKQKTNTHAA